MSNYNFEDDSKDFGETVRIDSINDEIRKSANINFERTTDFGEDIIMRKNRNGNGGRKTNRDGGILSGGLVKLSIIGGIIIFVLIFAVVFVSKMGGYDRNIPKVEKQNDINIKNENDVSSKPSVVEKNKDSVYGVVTNVGTDRNLRIYDIENKTNTNVVIDGSTVFKDEHGVEISYYDLSIGDVVSIKEADDSNTAASVVIPADAWKIENAEGVEIDASEKKIVLNEKKYSFGEKIYFLNDEKEVSANDISKTDKLTLKGVGNSVYSVIVESGHGYILIKNGSNIENVNIKIDGKEVLTESELMEVAVGNHEILVTGDNIDDYKTNVNIREKDRVDVDLSNVKMKEEKKLFIDINVNVKDYTIYVNGEKYTESSTIVEVPAGAVKLEVEKEGYEKWSTEVYVSDKPISVDVELKPVESQNLENNEPEGKVTIHSDPSWAKIYVNGEYIGVSPVMVTLPYGEHVIMGEIDGHDDKYVSITVSGPEKTVNVNFD
ncbi:MAG: PEGA domain-containing protein [Firmicutes bacterium]|nr:PEGA domain-containing protein [Bacillota bacterium]